MRIQQGQPEGAPAPVGLGGTWTLQTPAAGPGRRFRQTFALSLPTGEFAESIAVQIEDTLLSLYFSSHSFNACFDNIFSRV